jgi:hypothetical protein
MRSGIRCLLRLGIQFYSPNSVSFYLMGDDILVIENFNNNPVDVRINLDFSNKAELKLSLPEELKINYKSNRKELKISAMPSRSLLVFEY